MLTTQHNMEQGKAQNLLAKFGTTLSSPPDNPEKDRHYRAPQKKDDRALGKLIKQARIKNQQEVKAQRAKASISGQYWAEYGRLPAGMDDLVYLLPKAQWRTDPEMNMWQVEFGDRYSMEDLVIPGVISATGQIVSAETMLSEEEKRVLNDVFIDLSQRRRELRDSRGCGSHDNCCGLPTWACFLPVICCLGGCCYDQAKQRSLHKKVKQDWVDYIAHLNKTTLARANLSLRLVESTHYTVHWVGKNEIKHNQTNMETSSQTFKNSWVWKWELTPQRLCWHEVEKLRGNAGVDREVKAPVLVCFFGSAEPDSPSQRPDLRGLRPCDTNLSTAIGNIGLDLFV
ncbi:hypothetical protein ACHAXM_000279 [Skeletonema potamos]